jgi:hypothetical protein
VVINLARLTTSPRFTRQITRWRPTTTLANEGEATSTYASAMVLGSLQPSKDADVNLLPEGVRLSDCLAFYTSGDVQAGDGATQLPDILQVDAFYYRVLHLQDFRANGYVRVIALRYPAGTIPVPPAGGGDA